MSDDYERENLGYARVAAGNAVLWVDARPARQLHGGWLPSGKIGRSDHF